MVSEGRAGHSPVAELPQPSAAATAGFEPHRRELRGYCYRMLGSGLEAEDAVQETLLRAWRNIDRFDERRSAWRSWLFTIATNVCFDMLRSAQRRALAMDLGPASQTAPDLGSALPESRWVVPIADHRVLSDPGDPAELAAQRDTIRLAFVAALQHLPPRQRAVLILRDVLRWRAQEVAHLLETTVPSVNSTLQRARAKLAASRPAPAEPFDPLDAAQQRLLARYVEAFEQHDIEALTSLLHEDAIASMPPFSWWLSGRAAVRRVMEDGDGCRGHRLVATRANGTAAFGQYHYAASRDRYEPFALVVLEFSACSVAETTTFLDAARLFSHFDLPHDVPR